MKKTSLEIEKKLLPRLRFMGFVLLFFALFSCAYALIAQPYLSTVGLDDDGEELVVREEGFPEFDKTPGFIVTSFERINLFFVAFVFGGIGATCLLMFWKKRKEYQRIVDTLPAQKEEKKSS